jgi:hypothetical protein
LALSEQADPELAAVNRAWPTLPKPLRSALAALATSAVTTGGAT